MIKRVLAADGHPAQRAGGEINSLGPMTVVQSSYVRAPDDSQSRPAMVAC